MIVTHLKNETLLIKTVQFTPLIPQDIPRDRDTRVKYA